VSSRELQKGYKILASPYPTPRDVFILITQFLIFFLDSCHALPTFRFWAERPIPSTLDLRHFVFSGSHEEADW